MIEARTSGLRAVRAGKENSLQYLGNLVSLLVSGEDTQGQFAVIETRERRGTERPRHRHNHEDEVVYVLEGLVRFYVDGQRLYCPAGTCVLLPRNCEHSFSVESEEARLLVILVPAGMEGYYRDLGVPADDRDGHGSVGGQMDVERLVTVAARYGVEITGPPPTE